MSDSVIEIIIALLGVGFWLVKQFGRSKIEIENDEFIEELKEKQMQAQEVITTNRPNITKVKRVTNVTKKIKRNTSTPVLSEEYPINTESNLMEAPAPITPVVQEENNELLKDFDLRKAVIYSEIMKPKYEDF